MRKLIVLAFLAASGCATVAGVGEDISAGARSMERMF